MFRYYKTSGRIIRFGLRGPSGLASPLWRMWVQGDETYLAMRTAIGVSKISLHSSGQWMLRTGTSRVMINGPRRLNENWRVGPRIVFPGLPPISRLPIHDSGNQNTSFLFDEPLIHYWRDFAVLFSGEPAQPEEVDPLMPMGTELLGPLPLRNHGSAWLATFAAPMAADEISYIDSERAKFAITAPGGINTISTPWANIIQDTANGDTTIVNLELGRENVRLGE